MKFRKPYRAKEKSVYVPKLSNCQLCNALFDKETEWNICDACVKALNDKRERFLMLENV